MRQLLNIGSSPGRDSLPVSVTLALVLLVAGVLCLPSCSGRDSTPTRPPIAILGLDGICWKVMDRLMEDGQLPNLQILCNRGVKGDLETITPTRSPVIWTSIATGKMPDKHGIQAFFATVPGRGRVLVRSTDREAQAIWNIFSSHGLSTWIVDWWATWPAEEVNGLMVSDRVAFRRVDRFGGESGDSLYADQRPAQTYPPQLMDRILPLVVSPRSLTYEDLGQFIDFRELPGGGESRDSREYELRVVLARDRTYSAVAHELLKDGQPDLFAVYFQGTDIVSHYFWKYYFPEEWDEPIDPVEMELYRTVIPRYYSFADSLVGEIVAKLSDDTVILIVSDHGLVTGRRDFPESAKITVSAVHGGETKPSGVIIAAGPGIREGVTISGANVCDIAPTLLAFAELPVGRDMDGKVLWDLFEAGVIDTSQVAYTESYAREAPSADSLLLGTPMDEEMIEQLRSVGYIK